MRARISATLVALLVALLSPFQMPAAHAVASDGVGISTNGLQFYYDVANYYGMPNSLTLKDLSGNGRDASITQTTSQPSASSNNGGHLSFNASGGYAAAPAYNSFSTFTGFSFSFYANFGTQANSFERIIDFGNGAGNNNIEVGREGTGTNLFVEAWNGTYSPGYCRATGAIDTSWHFWVVTVGGGYCNIYKDNTLVTNNAAYNTLPAAGSWSNMYIGKSNWADAAFEGGIAELAFYNRALTSTEATQNYNAAMDQTAPTYTGSASFTPNENQTAVGVLSASESVSYIALTGSGDTAKFTQTGSNLSLTSTPNFEAPVPSNTLTYYFKLMDLNGNVSASTYVVTVYIQDVVEATSLSMPSLSATPYKGVAVTITVTPSGDGTSIPGKVNYLIAGKRIPACYKKAYTGTGNSTCTFDPALRGSQEISVTFTPTNTNYTAATSKKSFIIYKRSTIR
jgi:hypothetical protein